MFYFYTVEQYKTLNISNHCFEIFLPISLSPYFQVVAGGGVVTSPVGVITVPPAGLLEINPTITPSKKKNETNSHFSYGLVADKKKLWNAKRPKFLFGRCNTNMIPKTINGKSTNTHAKVTYPRLHNICNNQTHAREHIIFTRIPSNDFCTINTITPKIESTRYTSAGVHKYILLIYFRTKTKYIIPSQKNQGLA